VCPICKVIDRKKKMEKVTLLLKIIPLLKGGGSWGGYRGNRKATWEKMGVSVRTLFNDLLEKGLFWYRGSLLAKKGGGGRAN